MTTSTTTNNLKAYDFSSVKNTLSIKTSANIKDFSLPKFEQNMKIKNQEHYCACMACAITTALEYFNLIQTGRYKELSVGYVYGKHRKENSNSTGMALDPCLDSLLKLGTVDYNMCPDLKEMPEMKKSLKQRPELDEFAEWSKIKGFCKIKAANLDAREEQAKLALLNGFPIIGIFNANNPQSHTVCVYGYKEENGTLKLKYQNSYGETWGTKGRASASLESFDHLALLMDQEVTLPFTDVSKDQWFYKHVLNMYEAGYVNGKTDTTFEPNAFMTRAEVCCLLDKILSKLDRKEEAAFVSTDERLNRIEEKLCLY